MSNIFLYIYIFWFVTKNKEDVYLLGKFIEKIQSFSYVIGIYKNVVRHF